MFKYWKTLYVQIQAVSSNVNRCRIRIRGCRIDLTSLRSTGNHLLKNKCRIDFSHFPLSIEMVELIYQICVWHQRRIISDYKLVITVIKRNFS